MDYTNSTGYVLDTNGNRQYADRDAANGVPGTSLTARDRNMVTNELANLVIGSGLALDPNDQTQVYKAIGKILGPYVSGVYGKSASDYQILGFYYQTSSGGPVAVYSSGQSNVFLRIATGAQISTVQGNLNTSIANQATVNANVQQQISNTVSGIYGKSSSDYQMLGLYFQTSSSQPVAVYNNGGSNVFVSLPTSAQVAAIQANLQQQINVRVGTNATNDGTNAPVTILAYTVKTGVPWVGGPDFKSFALVKSQPSSGWNQVLNLSTDSSGRLTVPDGTGVTRVYGQSSSGLLAAGGAYLGGFWTRVDGILRQDFRVQAKFGDTITFPNAFTSTPVVQLTAIGYNGQATTANMNGDPSTTGFSLLSSYWSSSGQQNSGTLTLHVSAVGPG
ncbi:hypothetical protein [Asaia sp. HN010]|uniref:hypothetical protein n=1 Tax=Asaia sp. HN010 TaxID=3081233 RepID=UPI003015D2A4